MNSIYLDHAATTPVRPEVLAAMQPYFSEAFGNASSIHRFGQEAKKALEDAREVVATCLGVKPDEVCFMSGGTESDNLALKGIAYANQDKGKHLITSAIEHHAVLNCCRHLEEDGFEVTYVPVDEHGVVEVGAIEEAIREDTVLISVMLGNNETGTLQPISEIARIVKKRGVLLHTDAVQAVGKVAVNVDDLGVDLLSLTAHKLYGPKGVGALYVRQGSPICPLFHGGHHEHGKRAGTENVAGVVGLATAMQLASDEMQTTSPRLAALRDRLERGIAERIQHTRLNGHPAQRLPHILSMSFELVEGQSLLLALDMRGIAVSAGAACISGSAEPSHVLQAMRVDPAAAQGTVRFSVGRENTEGEMDCVLEALVEIVRDLRQAAPVTTDRTRE